MTDNEAQALGLRAMACPGWEWMPGMQFGDVGVGGHVFGGDDRIAHVSEWGAWGVWGTVGDYYPSGTEWPDFLDPNPRVPPGVGAQGVGRARRRRATQDQRWLAGVAPG